MKELDDSYGYNPKSLISPTIALFKDSRNLVPKTLI
jgi:hypothetical protein